MPPYPSVSLDSPWTATVPPSGTVEVLLTAVDIKCPDAPCSYQFVAQCRTLRLDKYLDSGGGTTAVLTIGADAATDMDTSRVTQAWFSCDVSVHMTDYGGRETAAGRPLRVR